MPPSCKANKESKNSSHQNTSLISLHIINTPLIIIFPLPLLIFSYFLIIIFFYVTAAASFLSFC